MLQDESIIDHLRFFDSKDYRSIQHHQQVSKLNIKMMTDCFWRESIPLEFADELINLKKSSDPNDGNYTYSKLEECARRR